MYLISLPYTVYWLVALSFVLSDLTHKESVMEPAEDVRKSMLFYLGYSLGISSLQVSLHGKLREWNAREMAHIGLEKEEDVAKEQEAEHRPTVQILTL